jgi:CheY-like chemotaxis protein
MHSTSPLILLLEDTVVAGLPLQSAVLMMVPEARFVWARTIEEARAIALETPIAVIVSDVELPDGNGIDFLMEAMLLHPEAGVIVMTGNPLPEYRGRVADLGSIRFYEKPVAPMEFVKAVRELLASHPTGAAAPRPGKAFQGTIKNLTPVDLIQLKCMAQATGGLCFQAPSGTGYVYFEKGRLVHAQTAAAQGEPALAEIVGYTGGKVSEEPPRIGPRTLEQDWQTLLMNAAHTHDERLAAAGR